MAMTVRVRFARRIGFIVFVTVMRIMYMGMVVFQRFMDVGVFVAFADVEINAKSHEQGGKAELQGDGIAKERDR